MKTMTCSSLSHAGEYYYKGSLHRLVLTNFRYAGDADDQADCPGVLVVYYTSQLITYSTDEDVYDDTNEVNSRASSFPIFVTEKQ